MIKSHLKIIYLLALSAIASSCLLNRVGSEKAASKPDNDEGRAVIKQVRLNGPWLDTEMKMLAGKGTARVTFAASYMRPKDLSAIDQDSIAQSIARQVYFIEYEIQSIDRVDCKPPMLWRVSLRGLIVFMGKDESGWVALDATPFSRLQAVE